MAPKHSGREARKAGRKSRKRERKNERREMRRATKPSIYFAKLHPPFKEPKR